MATTTAINSNINNIKQKFKSKFKLNNSILAAAEAEAAAATAAAMARSDHIDHVMPVERMRSLKRRNNHFAVVTTHDASVAVALHLNRGNKTTKSKTIQDSSAI